MKLSKLLLILPCLMFSAALVSGCGGKSTENTVIEAPGMTPEEEADRAIAKLVGL